MQEKAIAFPTDGRLYYKMLQTLVRVGKEAGIGLRQTYRRLSKKALARQGWYAHAKQMKRANKEAKKLKRCIWDGLCGIFKENAQTPISY